ncbi:MAG: magnesium-translocating P-type ATPase [Pseudomonadota bacterium]
MASLYSNRNPFFRIMTKAQAKFWNTPLPELLEALDSRASGLSAQEAKRRLTRYGRNLFGTTPRRSVLMQYLAHFKNPLVLILLVASGLSALMGEVEGAWIIWAIVLLSVTLDFIQEHRAQHAANLLKKQVAVRATVLRDGQLVETRIEKIVPGDVVLLNAGALVPADCRLLDAKDFFINQSVLTGETFPVEKHAGALTIATEALADADNAVFMGTSVVSGMATAVVCRTGEQTALGDIAETLMDQAPPTRFEIGLQSFGQLIMRLTIFLMLFVFLINAVFQRPLLESFLFSIALAVGLTPELLPMIVTLTLSRGAIRLSKQRVIVKKLSAIEDLGGMDLLCTDKTGTLTEARIRLERHVNALGEDSAAVLRLAYLNSHFESGLRSPLDDAILDHHELDAPIADEQWIKIDEVPFDFERRRVSVLIANNNQRQLIVKGAPEDVLKHCTQWQCSEGICPITDADRERIKKLQTKLGNEGFKVLGIAWRDVPTGHDHAVIDDETALTFAGFAAFLDPPKQSAAAAIKTLTNSGVSVRILTGDSEEVTRYVCNLIGMPVTGVLLGHDVAAMDDASLAARIHDVNLFCRINPVEKKRIILAFKLQGHTVGYLGDGINDAPSLHAADVGISVDTAVDVAREAADLILLKQDLNVICQGVSEGRRTTTNIMKYIMMGTSSNFGNMCSMAAATLFLPFLPLLPAQVLLNNLLYDLSEFPIPMDNVDSDTLLKPQHWDIAFIRKFMWAAGPVSSLFDFMTFGVMLWIFKANETLFHTGWFVESLASQVLAIFIIRTAGSAWKSRPNPWLAATSIGVVLLTCLLPFTPLASALGFEPLPPLFFAILAGMVASYLMLLEIVKRRFYQHMAKQQA